MNFDFPSIAADCEPVHLVQPEPPKPVAPAYRPKPNKPYSPSAQMVANARAQPPMKSIFDATIKAFVWHGEGRP